METYNQAIARQTKQHQLETELAQLQLMIRRRDHHIESGGVYEAASLTILQQAMIAMQREVEQAPNKLGE